MKENYTKFLDVVSNDKALSDEFVAYMKKVENDDVPNAIVTFANEKGFELSIGDLEADLQEIDDEELAAVSGGANKTCACVGMGFAEYDGKIVSCVGAGFFKGEGFECACFLTGAGYDQN